MVDKTLNYELEISRSIHGNGIFTDMYHLNSIKCTYTIYHTFLWVVNHYNFDRFVISVFHHPNLVYNLYKQRLSHSHSRFDHERIVGFTPEIP